MQVLSLSLNISVPAGGKEGKYFLAAIVRGLAGGNSRNYSKIFKIVSVQVISIVLKLN
jgi:hypothetical protein